MDTPQMKALEADIVELRALLNAQAGLPAEARATALSAIITAKSTLLAVDTANDVQRSIINPMTGPSRSSGLRY